jgi:hypothetical protein
VSIAFSHSTRSLQADRNNFSLLGLALASLILLAWGIWFYRAHFNVYETGQLSGATNGDAIVATFPPEAAARLQAGQTAQVRLAGSPTSISAIILHITNQDGKSPLIVELYPFIDDANTLTALKNGSTGQVDVEVAQVSPATLVARAARQWLNMPTVSSQP